MTPDLTSYELVHFLPFNREVYGRLFVGLNEDLFPLPLLTFAAALVALWRAWVDDGRTAGLLLAAAWVVVGAVFFVGRYADLLWAAPYIGGAFIAQGFLLAGFAANRRLEFDDGRRKKAGLAIAAAGLLAYPLLAPLAYGRGWNGIEVFGLAPDPTVLMTVGVLVALRPVRWALWIVPVLWLAATALTQIALTSLG